MRLLTRVSEYVSDMGRVAALLRPVTRLLTQMGVRPAGEASALPGRLPIHLQSVGFFFKSG